MKNRRFTIGPGAASLILIIVVLSMSALGVLSLMNARNDAQLSRRSLSVAQQAYALNDRAEVSMAALDAVLARCAQDATDDAQYLTQVRANLPEGMAMDARVVSWEERDADGRTLNCSAMVTALGASPRAAWIAHELSMETEEMELDNVWD